MGANGAENYFDDNNNHTICHVYHIDKSNPYAKRYYNHDP